MREAHAFRFTGRTASEKDLGDVMRLAFNGLPEGCFAVDQCFIRCIGTQWFALIKGESWHTARKERHRLEEKFGLRHREDTSDFRGREPDVNRDHHKACVGTREVYFNITKTVASEHSHSIAWLDTPRKYSSRQLGYPLCKLAIRKPHVTIDNRKPVPIDNCCSF